jgi:hypothetical protein
MTAIDPTTTHQLFQHDRVAAGYASARPYLHPEVLARVRELIRPAASAARSMSLRHGLSSVALRDPGEVVGVDVSRDMLRRAAVRRGASSPPRRRICRSGPG